MDRLKERLALASRALGALQEAIALDYSTIVRDATIQRFEFTFEAAWKAARLYLLEREGLDVASPKGVIRACHQAGVLNEVQALQALQMADDRNLTSHTYDEAVAEAIAGRLPVHTALIGVWIERMQAR